jgi:hypothetical protein
MSRLMSRPFATLLAVASAILIIVGRVNRDQPWGDPVFIAGILVLVIAAALLRFRQR